MTDYVSVAEKVAGIYRARKATSASLVTALKGISEHASESQLAKLWQNALSKQEILLPSGWYQPPPSGMSVLIGNGESYERLHYESLRAIENWPSDNYILGPDSVLYPYYSAIDRNSLMIGDFVGTFYGGNSKIIREWYTLVYASTLKIAEFACPGMQFSELYAKAAEIMARAGASNNTFSQSGGLASDIGHTVPFFDVNLHRGDRMLPSEMGIASFFRSVADARVFISGDSEYRIGEDAAFTIEPQMLAEGVPMASFHLIVIFLEGQRQIIREFDDIFALFRMTDWIQ